MLRRSPVYIRDPGCKRGASQILAVLLLTGLALAGAATVFSLGDGINDVLFSGTSCDVGHAGLYKTGPQKAYLVTTVANTRTVPGDVTLPVRGDYGAAHREDMGSVGGGESVTAGVPLDVPVTREERYVLRTTITAAQGSADCTEPVTAQ